MAWVSTMAGYQDIRISGYIAAGRLAADGVGDDPAAMAFPNLTTG
jgi:hypothetical protein